MFSGHFSDLSTSFQIPALFPPALADPPLPSKYGTPGPRRSPTRAWGCRASEGPQFPNLPAHLHGGSPAASPLSASLPPCTRAVLSRRWGAPVQNGETRDAAKWQRGLFPAGAFLAALSGPKEKQPLSLAATPLPGPPTPALAACAALGVGFPGWVCPHLGSGHPHQLSALPAPPVVHSPWSCSLPCPAERCPQPQDGACVLGAAHLGTA